MILVVNELVQCDVKTSIKSEITKDDEEFEFKFELDAEDYFRIVKELRANDDDLIEIEGTQHTCPHTGCMKKVFTRRR